MIPNKTEEQILYNQFKFYDIESSGFCTLQNFIKTNERLGVVLGQLEDFEIIFNYFADPETSLLNYKKFIYDIFRFKSIKLNKENNNIEEEKDDDFIDIFTKKIIYKGGLFTLIDIIKKLNMNDFEGNKRMNTEDFLRVLQKCQIFFNPEETKALLRGFEYFENGVVKYQILINILLEQFWDEKKLSISKQIYNLLSNNGSKNLTLNIMKKYFDEILEDSSEKEFFLNFIDAYKTINTNNISQREMIKFLKFYNFGQKSSNCLIDLINVIRDDDIGNKKKLSIDDKFIKGYEKEKENEKFPKKNNYLSRGYEYENGNPRINKINFKLREKFIKFGRKSIFNFLKHFKYYDNFTSCISKYDFSKVLKDFNIKLTTDEVDIIFLLYGMDKVSSSFKYGKFFNDFALSYSSKQRQKVIDFIFETIKERAESLERDVDINFLKEIYNAKNNYFKEDETENKLDFDDCLDLFHYSYKGFKYDEINNNEFNEFYLFISLLVPNDDDFYFMISNEWRVPLNKIKCINNKKNLNLEELPIEKNENELRKNQKIQENIKDYKEINDNFNNKSRLPVNRKNLDKDNNLKSNKSNIKNFDFPRLEKEEALSLLTNKLYKRGLRGILYLYKQFLTSCEDLNKITFDDFAYVFKVQHIDLGYNVLKRIFSLFNSYNYLDFYQFIRNYKKELNNTKLNIVEDAFTLIDTKAEDKVPLNVIKMKYSAKNHPDVLNGKITEDQKLMEFLDCFTLCYDILKLDNKGNDNEDDYVDFEIFANFYEFVSFIYPKDKDFQSVVNSSWNN